MAGGGGAGVWPGLRVSARGVVLKGSERPEAGCLGEYISILWAKAEEQEAVFGMDKALPVIAMRNSFLNSSSFPYPCA